MNCCHRYGKTVYTYLSLVNFLVHFWNNTCTCITHIKLVIWASMKGIMSTWYWALLWIKAVNISYSFILGNNLFSVYNLDIYNASNETVNISSHFLKHRKQYILKLMVIYLLPNTDKNNSVLNPSSFQK